MIHISGVKRFRVEVGGGLNSLTQSRISFPSFFPLQVSGMCGSTPQRASRSVGSPPAASAARSTQPSSLDSDETLAGLRRWGKSEAFNPDWDLSSWWSSTPLSRNTTGAIYVWQTNIVPDIVDRFPPVSSWHSLFLHWSVFNTTDAIIGLNEQCNNAQRGCWPRQHNGQINVN